VRLEDPVDLNKDFARVSRAETATIAMRKVPVNNLGNVPSKSLANSCRFSTVLEQC
jgi:hypothetical protein